MTQPKANVQVLTAKEAQERLPLRKHFNNWGEQIRFVDGDLVVSGDLLLDDAQDLYVSGDLTVAGSIVNADGEEGPFLFVGGETSAKNIINGGSEFVFAGDVRLENSIYGHYNHGSLAIYGDVTAAAIIADDHLTDIRGKVTGVTADTGFAFHAEFSGDDVARVLVKGVLDGKSIDHGALIKWLVSSNKIPVKEGVEPSRMSVAKDLARRVKAGAKIKTLSLANKDLREIPAAVFKLTDLERLDLSGNEIKKLPASGFKALTKLRELVLYSVPAKTLPLKKLTNLELLDLTYCKMSIGEDLGLLQQLRVLKLGPFIKEPNALGDLPQLEVLQVRAGGPNPRDDFPEMITRLKGLKSLDISDRLFAEVPKSFSQLTQLEELNISGSVSKLKALPELSGMTKLKKLIFGGRQNKFGQPHAQLHHLVPIFALSSLEHLELDGWGPEDDRPALVLPDDAFAELKNLRFLSLAFNKLEELPSSFFELPKLEKADLRFNCLPPELIARLHQTYPKAEIDVSDQR